MSDLKYEERMRLKFNQYAYSKAYKRLKMAIDENNNHEIYSSIGELLLWVMTTHEWHKVHGQSDYTKRARKDNKGTLLFGLAHAYNSLKHNMKLFVMHNKHDGFSFENVDFSNFDFRPFIIKWIKADNLLDEGYDNQRRNYINFIEGKEVLETFDEVLIFLNNENQTLLFD
ncbi:hypothetical protein [Cytobacillus oceanisediminis]|uniref:hypothetical protein n=1 Tax=Cytobacillus oceanisediminis TaxID=665099 RepID=UPI001C21812F|nr:hypothetical protein [Cytobacillus oceanisediminis]MBU8773177.1 hypothetical protein [Cytobacillus oceanisediminis]